MTVPDSLLQDAIREFRWMRKEVSILRSIVLGGRHKYDLKHAAERLGVSKRTLQRRIDNGSIVRSKEGGRVFVTEAAIRDYEDAQRRAK